MNRRCASVWGFRFSSTCSPAQPSAASVAPIERIALCLAAALLLSYPLRAQNPDASAGLTISGRVAGSDGRPLPYSTASIPELGAERFSNDLGEFFLTNLAPGSYHLRVKQLGFAAFDTVIVVRPDRSPPALHVVLVPVPFRLATVTVRGRKSGCVVPGTDSLDADDAFGLVLAELQKNAERERLLTSTYPFEFRLLKFYEPAETRVGPTPPPFQTELYRSDERPRYAPGQMVRTTAALKPPNNRVMVIPVLADLGDPAFLRSHCYAYGGTQSEGTNSTLRVDFTPAPSLKSPDVEGSVFLDATSFVIKRAVFRLTRPDRLKPPVVNLEVTTTFREIFPGVAVVDEVRSVQTVRTLGYSSGTSDVAERQHLLGFKFLSGQPGDSLRRQ
jgi:hypothetical protein